ncbi:hypothetical protein HG263_14595 [Pseudoalteromonas sp. JBTF-M23]|uniref:O-antigen ligase-like membrane protein n=1 Tax=Pseudoalteromonas caenipelagi TaxID=2726988 RepID=A0A849VGZ0_9GAMM|nr:O-antigen ligase family protein [Pseudoalteromonas caenipelagi]NOU51763.1 hypothetical protein [Pseudoalteromonas caenipelagi]
METSLEKKLTHLGLLIITLIYFRTTIGVILGSVVADLVIVSTIILLPAFIFLIFRRQVYGHRKTVFFYIVYCFLAFLITPLSSEYGSYFGGFIGLTNLVFLVVFWLVLLSYRNMEDNIQKFAGLFLIIGGVNAVGAIIQSTISIDLFGLVSHGVYTNEQVLANENVNVRAVSFISSPQSLALFLSFCLCLSFSYDWRRQSLKYFTRGLLFFAGVLTVSKVFFVFIFFYILFSYLSPRKIIKLFFSVVLFFTILLFFKEHLGRVFEMINILENIESYSAFIIWSDSFKYAIQFPEVIFGHGVGVFSRGSQSLLNYQLLYGSTESFFIQVLAEIGIIGLVFLLSLTFSAVKKYYAYDRRLMGLLSAFFIVGFFTPALYGYTIGMSFYFTLLLPLVSKRTNIEK